VSRRVGYGRHAHEIAPLTLLSPDERAELSRAQAELLQAARAAGAAGVRRTDRVRRTLERLEALGLVTSTCDVRVACGRSQLVWTVIAVSPAPAARLSGMHPDHDDTATPPAPSGTRLLNATPHAVVLHRLDGSTVELPPCGVVPRVSSIAVPLGVLDGVPLVRHVYGEVEGLPAPEEGVVLIVSAMVRAACPDRSDLVSPGDLVRDAQGRVVGCRTLVGGAQ